MSAVSSLDNVKLTPYQLIFYYEWLHNSLRNDYNIFIDDDISGEIDFDRFQASFLKVANDYFILSHNISNEVGGIYWKPRKPTENVVVYHSQKLSDQQIYNIISAPFNLESDLYMRIHLIKLQEKKYRMIFIFPYIVFDSVSTEEIWEKFRKNYNGSSYECFSLVEQIELHKGLTTYFEELLVKYQDDIHVFWQKHLQNVEGIDLGFLQKEQSVVKSPRWIIDECLFSFDEETYTQVKKLKYCYKITPYFLGQMVMAILFHKLTSSKKVALSYSIAFTEAEELMYGAHINTMLIDYGFDDQTILQTLINYAFNFFKDLKSSKAKYLPVNIIAQYADSPNVFAFKKTLPTESKSVAREEFQQLTYDAYYYQYDNKLETGFRVDPISFELKKGKITFIYGSNWAGKTTMVCLLLGLLEKQNAISYLNDQVLTSFLLDYNLFFPIFSDFHLFDRFYGLTEIDLDKANEYLRLFELAKKVTLEKDRFSSTALSTGQRNRLTLIAILLEKRSTLILAEWAADQDPAFRKKFYTNLKERRIYYFSYYP